MGLVWIMICNLLVNLNKSSLPLPKKKIYASQSMDERTNERTNERTGETGMIYIHVYICMYVCTYIFFHVHILNSHSQVQG